MFGRATITFGIGHVYVVAKNAWYVLDPLDKNSWSWHLPDVTWPDVSYLRLCVACDIYGNIWLIMAALCNRTGHYIFPCGYFLLSIFYLFSSPNLSGRRLDDYHTSTHGVALVRIYNAGLKCAAWSSLEIQDAKMMQKIAICAPSNNFVVLYLRN